MNVRLTQALRRARQIRPNGIALIDGDERWTWNEFGERVERFAGMLRDFGVRPGDRVAMLSLNSHRYVEYYLGTLWAGAAIVPLNHRLTERDLAALLSDAEPSVILASEPFADIARTAAEQASSAARLVLAAAAGRELEGFVNYEAALARAEPIPEMRGSADDLACLYYTGGTTGRPKGVMLTHANIFFNSLNLIPEARMDSATVHLHAGPLFHVAAGVRIYSVSLVAGTHVVHPRFELPDVLEVIERHQVTLATFVPTMLHRIVEDPALADYTLPSLRVITYGAAPMPRALIEKAMARFAQVRFIQSYGMTETSPVVSILSAEDHGDQGRLGSAGRPALSTEIRIADAQGKSLSCGETGEIMVRGPMVMAGYWRNPEATAAAIEDGWLHTGDVGYLDSDGYLFVVDRIKDVIISGGENVYSTEVEQVLASHPAVLQCAVFGVPDARWGERVHAVVVLRHQPQREEVDGDVLGRHCRDRLAGYKCPRSFDLRSEPLPISSVNKVLKTELRREMLTALADAG